MCRWKVAEGLVHAVVKCIVPAEGSTTKAYVKRLKTIMLKLTPLFANYVKMRDQVDFIFSTEDACAANRHAFTAFQTILHAWYEDQHELIGEDAVSAKYIFFVASAHYT